MNNNRFSIMKKIVWVSLTILLICCVPIPAFGASLDTYGNIFFETVYRIENESFQTDYSSLATNLFTYACGDLFVRGTEEQTLLQFLLDFKYEYSNTLSSYTPVLYANQFYIIVPLNDNSFLYCGRKYKKVGVAKFFNVSNRYDRGGCPADILEYDILNSDSFNYGFITNFRNAQNWDQVQFSAFTDFNDKNFNMQGYCYSEGVNGYFLVANVTYQLNSFQFYGEAIYMSHSDQKIVTQDTGNFNNDFQAKDLSNTTKITAGTMINNKNYSIVLEYSRNNQGFTPKEQDDFINYLNKYGGYRKPYIDNFRGLLAKNYLGLSFYLPKLINNDFSLNSYLIGSLPDENPSEYASYESSINIAYIVAQNLTLNLGAVYRFGGEKGEFKNLNEEQLFYQFSTNYSF